jgi:hypothetical protein
MELAVSRLYQVTQKLYTCSGTSCIQNLDFDADAADTLMAVNSSYLVCSAILIH